MAERRFKVRVFVQAEVPGDPGREDFSRSFNLTARHADKAAAQVRARLAEAGLEVLSISHAPENGIVATVGREPRKGAPAIVARVASPRPRPRRAAGDAAARKGARR